MTVLYKDSHIFSAIVKSSLCDPIHCHVHKEPLPRTEGKKNDPFL